MWDSCIFDKKKTSHTQRHAVMWTCRSCLNCSEIDDKQSLILCLYFLFAGTVALHEADIQIHTTSRLDADTKYYTLYRIWKSYIHSVWRADWIFVVSHTKEEMVLRVYGHNVCSILAPQPPSSHSVKSRQCWIHYCHSSIGNYVLYYETRTV